MFYNKKTLRTDRIKTTWHHPKGAITGNVYDYDMYENYIDEIDPSARYEKYYFISPFIAVRQYEERLNKMGEPYNYHKAIDMIVSDAIKSQTINDDLEEGNTCVIFDMGVEHIEREVYDKINAHFKNSKHSNNVKYWTMIENCNWTDVIEIVSASSSTCRFADWDYEKGIAQADPEYYKTHYAPEIESLIPKHVLFLNRRLRSHRVLLMAEFLHRKENINKNFHLSFLGSENENITKEMEKSTLLGYSWNFEHLDKKVFEELWDDWYGNKLPYSLETSRDEWLAGSNLNRVTEMLPFRRKSYVELITEFTTTNDGYVCVSEKLSQAILSKKPFIIAGDKHYIKVLKTLGFKTFSDFWDEGYDELDYNDRLLSIVDTVQGIIKNTEIKTDSDNNIIYSDKMQEILEYNYNHYKKVYAPNVYKRIFRSLSVGNVYVDKPGLTKENISKYEWTNGQVWYQESSNIVYIPVYGIADYFFYDVIAPELGFRLMDKKFLDLTKTRNLVFTRNPAKRFSYGLSKLENKDNFSLSNLYLQPQTSFYDQNHIHCTIDIDAPNTNGLHVGTNWGYGKEEGFGERELVRDIYLLFEKYYTPEEFPEVIMSDEVKEYYKKDFMYYYKRGSWRFKKANNQDNISSKFKEYMKNFNVEFKDELKKISATTHSEYFKGSLKEGYWLNHQMIMDNLGLCFAPKDIKILDVGTHFGFIPHFLKREGFTNVNCCNSYKEAGDTLPELKNIWNIMGIRPYDLHIHTKKRFELDQKYDIIFITMSNIFWRSDKIVRLHGGSVNQAWEIVDKKGEKNTFFTPYEVGDLDFFIKNIYEFLTPGGVAVVQPYPYVYNMFEGFKDEQSMLQFYQNPEIAHETPRSTEHNPNKELNDFFVIQREGNRDDKGPIW